MKIYHYHSESGIFISEGLADESPLEPGVWLIPAFATCKPAPESVAGKIAKWDTDTQDWILIDQPQEQSDPELVPFNAIDLPELTPLQKIERLGLTVQDLKEILGMQEQ